MPPSGWCWARSSVPGPRTEALVGLEELDECMSCQRRPSPIGRGRARLDVLHCEAAGSFEVLPGHLTDLPGARHRPGGSADVRPGPRCAGARPGYTMARKLLGCDAAVSTHHHLEARVRTYRVEGSHGQTPKEGRPEDHRRLTGGPQDDHRR